MLVWFVCFAVVLQKHTYPCHFCGWFICFAVVLQKHAYPCHFCGWYVYFFCVLQKHAYPCHFCGWFVCFAVVLQKHAYPCHFCGWFVFIYLYFAETRVPVPFLRPRLLRSVVAVLPHPPRAHVLRAEVQMPLLLEGGWFLALFYSKKMPAQHRTLLQQGPMLRRHLFTIEQSNPDWVQNH